MQSLHGSADPLLERLSEPVRIFPNGSIEMWKIFERLTRAFLPRETQSADGPQLFQLHNGVFSCVGVA